MKFIDGLKRKKKNDIKDFGSSIQKSEEIKKLEAEKEKLDGKIKEKVVEEQQKSDKLEQPTKMILKLRVASKEQFVEIKEFELYMIEKYGYQAVEASYGEVEEPVEEKKK